MTAIHTPHHLDQALETTRQTPECQSWLNDYREAGRKRFQELGLPGRKNESWKFTNVNEIAKTSFVDPPREAPALTDAQADQFNVPALEAVRLTFIDGRFSEALSDDPTKLGEQVTCCKITEAICEHRELIEPYIGRQTRQTDDAFTALNNANLRSGIFIHAPKGVSLEKPVHILNIATRTDQPVAAHPRNVIVGEEASGVRVIEQYVSLDNEAVYLNNAVTEVYAADHAKIEHYLLERESEAAYNISTLAISQGQKSDVHSHTVLLGGHIVRNNVAPRLVGESAHCLINGLFVGHRKQHLDNNMRVHHVAPNCHSRQYYKGILNDQARGVFSGRIVVDQSGQQTDAVQSNKNLLLSDAARINARPQLEIYADDVTCTHGATTGEVDEEAVFYFRSRGLSEPVARAMLLYAFASEGFDRMDLRPVRQLLAGEMLAKLPYARDLSIEV